MLPPRVGQYMFYCQIVWQAGRFVKSVPRFVLKLAENVPKSMLLDVPILSAGGDRATELGVIGESHRISFERSKRVRAGRKRHAICVELAPKPQEHVVIVLCSKAAY